MKLCLGIQIFFFLRHLHNVAQSSHGSWDNGNFLYRLRVLLHCCHKGMSYLVVRNNLSLLLGKDTILLFLTHQNHFHRLKQVLLANLFSTIFYRSDGGFVHHVGKIRSHRTAGGQGDFVKVHAVVQLDVLGMHL